MSKEDGLSRYRSIDLAVARGIVDSLLREDLIAKLEKKARENSKSATDEAEGKSSDCFLLDQPSRILAAVLGGNLERHSDKDLVVLLEMCGQESLLVGMLGGEN